MPKIIAIRNVSQDKICRTCLQEGAIISIYDNCSNGICILEKLISCTLVQFTENDGLPTNICSNCLNQINEAYLFNKRCEEVDKILRKYYEKPLINKSKRRRKHSTENSDEETSKLSNNNDEDGPGSPNTINFVVVTSDSEEETTKTPDETEVVPEIEKEQSVAIIEDVPIENKNVSSDKRFGKGPPYKCRKCDVSFPVFHLLKEHYRKPEHKNQTTKPCEICSKPIRYLNYYKHMSIHNNDKRYCCEFCGRHFNNDSNLARHRNIHLGIKPYLCDFCGRKFTQSSAMKAHRRIHTGERPYICDICGKTFKSNTELNNHTAVHQKYGGNSDTNEDVLKKRSRGPKEVPIEEWLNKEIVLRQENASKPEIDSVDCNICKQTFRTPAGLKTHMVVHEEKIFNCTQCLRKFSSLERLESHMKSHSAVRPFSCHICGKTFITKLCLKNHTFLHTGAKPYSCEHCNKSFVHLGQLRSHAFIHTGDRPHICKYCGKAFALNGNLTVHIRKHTGENPFVCDVCNKGFVDSSALKKHYKTHNAKK